jgi:outer membrane protein assembly factor BamB
MLGRDAGHTGYVPEGGPATDSPDLTWNAAVAIEQGDILSTPLIAGETVFIGAWNAVYAVGIDDGAERWTHEIDNNAGFISPAMSGDAIHFGELGVDTGAVSAFGRADGEERWRRDLRPNSSLTAADGRLYVHGYDDGSDVLYGLDAADGATDWRFDPGWESAPRVVASPAVGDGAVFAVAARRGADGDGTLSLYGLDAADGRVRFRYDAPVQPRSDPTYSGGTVYVGTADGVAAVDAASGDERWTAETAGPVRTSPATDGETVYVADMENALYGFEAGSGERVWRQDTGFRVDQFRSHPAITDDAIYLGGDNLAAFDRDGGTRWTFSLRAVSSAFTTPALADDCVVFASCEKMRQGQNYDNYLYALR